MTLELTDDLAMTLALYDGLGQTVTYAGAVDGSVNINVIIDDADEEFPGGFEATAADADAVARVLRTDVPTPRRADTITDAAAVIYTVDDYRKLNHSEWRMDLRRG